MRRALTVQVALQRSFLFTTFGCMVHFTTLKAVLGGRRSLPPSCNRCGCGGCGRFYLSFASGDSSRYSILGFALVFLFIPFSLLFLGGHGWVNIVIIVWL